MLIRNSLYSNGKVTVIKISNFTVWLKIKQSSNTDIFLAGVYIPPLDSSSTISSFQDNNAFHLIQEEISHFNKRGTVAICGDFNARTGKLQDFLLTPGNDIIDMPGSLPITPEFPNNFPRHNRYSDDSKCNRYGKELIVLCKSSGMQIMNGYFMEN